MPSFVIAILLIATLLLVHFSMRSHPMSARRPLDVDQGLPLPDAGQASTIFSLTALFGAYFAIYLLLGIPALFGLACGTVVSLFALRGWIKGQQPKSFESYLLGMLSSDSRNGIVFAVVVSLVQCVYASSELLILKEISRVLLGIRPDHATLVAVGTGLIGYFYILFGGYMAVFRTDVLQFILVAAMAVAFSIYAFNTGLSGDVTINLEPRTDYWKLPLIGTAPKQWMYLYHFAIGVVMGFGFLVAAPDAWKRVFIVTTLKKDSLSRFLTFVCVGFMPFLVLLPVALTMSPISDGLVSAGIVFGNFATNDVLFIVAALGLIACFLSSFDSAVLASVHVGLILRRQQRYVETEIARFHWLMVTVLVIVFSLFQVFSFFGNPYLLANLLLGPYAVIAGIQAGTGAKPARLPENSVLWIAVIGFTCWFVYFVSVVGFPKVPTTYQINTVPGGVVIFLTIALACKILVVVGNRR